MERTLYVPAIHAVDDTGYLQRFMGEFPFVELITTVPNLHVSHLPVLVDDQKGDFGTIYGHVARGNAHANAIAAEVEALVIFRGPHAYISPSWYAKRDVVPTWNYAVVHATGRLKPVTGESEFRDLLAKLMARFEEGEGSSTRMEQLADDYLRNLIRQIAGFELVIDRLESKFKLGQERTDGDRTGILARLPERRPDPALEQLTEDFYRRIGRLPGSEA